jgi:hypothetical protein
VAKPPELFWLKCVSVTVRVLVMLDMYFVSVKYVFDSIKLMCVCVKLLKIYSASKKGIFVISEKPKIVFAKCIWMGGNLKMSEG